MPKGTRRRKSRDGKTASDRNKLDLTAESALPPKKPPAPSAHQRLRRAKLRKLK